MGQSVDWEWEILPQKKWTALGLGELWHYRGLLQSFIRRELIAGYQQTIMGMFWLVLQPLLTTLFYFVVFGKIIKASTEGPAILFYMSGSILWGFFSDCFSSSMYVFIHNAHIFNKVYFPRLIVPLSMVATHAVRMGIQMGLFIIVYLFYWFTGAVHPSLYVLLVPVLLVLIAAFGMGAGMIVSIYMAKYRDLDQVMNFLLRLLMFITPVVYPAAIVPGNYQILFWLNPLTPIIETFRAAFSQQHHVPLMALGASCITITIVLVIGTVVFKQREVKVMDTI